MSREIKKLVLQYSIYSKMDQIMTFNTHMGKIIIKSLIPSVYRKLCYKVTYQNLS